LFSRHRYNSPRFSGTGDGYFQEEERFLISGCLEVIYYGLAETWVTTSPHPHPHTTEFRNLVGLFPVYRLGADCRTADTAGQLNEQAAQKTDPLNILMVDHSLTTKKINFQKRSLPLTSDFIILSNRIPNTQQTYKTTTAVLLQRL
jgi:hypothetical protein